MPRTTMGKKEMKEEKKIMNKFSLSNFSQFHFEQQFFHTQQLRTRSSAQQYVWFPLEIRFFGEPNISRSNFPIYIHLESFFKLFALIFPHHTHCSGLKSL